MRKYSKESEAGDWTSYNYFLQRDCFNSTAYSAFRLKNQTMLPKYIIGFGCLLYQEMHLCSASSEFGQ